MSRWIGFWFEPIPPHVYAVLRVGFGLAGLFVLVIRADLAALWDLSGFVPLDRGWTGFKHWVAGIDSAELTGRAIFLYSAVVFLAMTAGVRSRVTVPLAFAAAMLQHGWNSLPMSGADGVLRAFLFCLIWVDCGAVWSVDSWRARTQLRRSMAEPSKWQIIGPLQLVRFQLAVIYMSAGLYKLKAPMWLDGSAVHYTLHSNGYQRFPGLLTPQLDWLATLATYGTLFWELGFGVLVLFAATRGLALLAGALIHLGMFALMEVGPFHLVMLAAYPAFLNPQTVAALGTRWSRSHQPRTIDHVSVLQSARPPS